ncbi:MAG: hypothetical protein JRE18_11750 [Deltaproteobacteria bacterium]|nr:hypothetical protein [Deltaproteobacteria bacterium]
MYLGDPVTLIDDPGGVDRFETREPLFEFPEVDSHDGDRSRSPRPSEDHRHTMSPPTHTPGISLRDRAFRDILAPLPHGGGRTLGRGPVAVGTRCALRPSVGDRLLLPEESDLPG